MIVTFIGYRGCGKSSVGKLLAQQLDWKFCDADVELESRAGKTIQQIFTEAGEISFRDLEEELIADLVGEDKLVLAAGGGAILREATRLRFRAAGPVVWLTAAPDTLYHRIHNDETTGQRRPDLTKQGGEDEVRSLLEQRAPLYRETATMVIDTEQKSIEEIVNEVREALLALEGFPR